MKQMILDACSRIVETGNPETIHCVGERTQSFRVTLNSHWNRHNEKKIAANYDRKTAMFTLSLK